MCQDLSLSELLDRAAAEREHSHGVRVVLVTADEDPPQSHLPGAAWLTGSGTQGPHPSLLGRRDQEIWIASPDSRLAQHLARQLGDRGHPVRHLAQDLPASELRPGPPTAALWSPDPYLAERLTWLNSGHPGTVLDLGCGSGRDAVFLAQTGRRVVGIDRLGDALDLGRRRARHHGVQVEWLERRVRSVSDLPATEIAAVVMARFHSDEILDELHRIASTNCRLLLHGYGPPSATRPGPKRAERAWDLDAVGRILAPHWHFDDGPRQRDLEDGTWIELSARLR